MFTEFIISSFFTGFAALLLFVFASVMVSIVVIVYDMVVDLNETIWIRRRIRSRNRRAKYMGNRKGE